MYKERPFKTGNWFYRCWSKKDYRMLLKKINRLLMYCSNRKKFCCCKKTMKNIKIVLRVLTLSQTPANLTSLTNLNSQVSRCLIVKDWQNLLRLVIFIWLTKKKIILILKKKKKKKLFEKYLQEFMEKFMLWQQGKEINQIVKKQWSGKLELNFNSEKERFKNIFKRNK